MCIQQPQDSSQRSAVIAHYNQSSWAHLGSPFGILHWELCKRSKMRLRLWDRGFLQRIPRHKDGVGRQVKAQPAPVGPSELPRVRSWTGAAPQGTQELGWAAGQESLPHLTGLPAIIVGALPGISRTRAEPEHRKSMSKERNGSSEGRSGLRLGRWKKNAS